MAGEKVGLGLQTILPCSDRNPSVPPCVERVRTSQARQKEQRDQEVAVPKLQPIRYLPTVIARLSQFSLAAGIDPCWVRGQVSFL